MTDEIGSAYQRLSERYRSGNVPWDDPLPPPEVIEYVTGRSAGKALDLGCGYGRAAIFMARLGWEVDAIDFISEAVAEAARRSRAARTDVRFHIASIFDLDFLVAGYDLALDVGCGHNLDEGGWRLYVGHLRRLLKPGGTFMLFGRLQQVEGNQGDDGPMGMDLAMVRHCMEEAFTCLWEKQGITEVPDQSAWPSIWLRFQRN